MLPSQSNGTSGTLVRYGDYRVPVEAFKASVAIPLGKYDRILLASALLREGWKAS